MTKGKNDKIVLAVGAHADDMEFSSAGTLAKWIRQDWTVYYLICTDGSKGSDNLKMTGKKLAAIRRKEQKDAAKILGVKDVFFLNHPDTELLADYKLKEEITYYLRKLRPGRVITMNPNIIFWKSRHFVNHTDHRAVAEATIDSVFPLARDRLTFPQHERQGLKPHKVDELYLTSMDEANFISDISKTMDIKLEAIRAHKSQATEEWIKVMKDWAAKNGRKKRYKFCELFIRLKLP